ncbi:MAG: sigma-70 family RNA polymerase sigma factor [Parvibaculaceae bacterium]|nr:sigma-70 family RNA polymerase sigma factor [Parvibaculaceae bacterium]
MKEAGTKLDLYLHHRADLIDYAAPIVGDRMQAEDVVQEAWMRFSVAVDKERGEADRIVQPVGYLYRIVRNLALDFARRLTSDAWHPAGEAVLQELPSRHASPEQETLHRNELRLVGEALAELPQRTRLAFDLHRFEGKTFAEIGVALGISQTRAHNLVQEAMLHCMERLGEAKSTPDRRRP